MSENMAIIYELHGRLLAHRLFISSLVKRMSSIREFQSMGLANDIANEEASIDTTYSELPDHLLEAATEELQNIFDSIQAGRNQ
jgi:hypothetical protein